MAGTAIALIIYKVGRALDTETALFLTVKGGNVPPEFVGYFLRSPSVLQSVFNFQTTSEKLERSPQAALGEIGARGLEFETKISVRTLYRYIDMGFIPGVSNKDLPIKRSKDKRRKRVSLGQLGTARGKA